MIKKKVLGKISILMAVYNASKTVDIAIESILKQTYENWQFIICDDCSTDNTLEIITSYSKKYPEKFIIIHNDKNIRLAASLNHCLKYADGEFCARMDGDDYVSERRFEKQVRYLKEHSDIQLVGTLMQSFSDDGKLGRIIKYKEFPDKYELRFGPCFSHASILTYTYVYEKLNGYTISQRTKRTQDYDLWFRFFAAGFKGATYQEPLYFVRENEKAYLRRNASLYLWAIVTRWKGFRLLKYPLKYYWRILLPLPALFINEFRKIRIKIKQK